MGANRYCDKDRLDFLIDRPRFTVMLDKATIRWAVYDVEAQKEVSRWHDSARAALDEAIDHKDFIDFGMRAT